MIQLTIFLDGLLNKKNFQQVHCVLACQNRKRKKNSWWGQQWRFGEVLLVRLRFRCPAIEKHWRTCRVAIERSSTFRLVLHLWFLPTMCSAYVMIFWLVPSVLPGQCNVVNGNLANVGWTKMCVVLTLASSIDCASNARAMQDTAIHVQNNFSRTSAVRTAHKKFTYHKYIQHNTYNSCSFNSQSFNRSFVLSTIRAGYVLNFHSLLLHTL